MIRGPASKYLGFSEELSSVNCNYPIREAEMSDLGHEAGVGGATRARESTVTSRSLVGRQMPLNSRRLTAALLKQLAGGLDVPTSASMEEVRQLIDGKLGELGRDPRNTRAVLEEGDRGTRISLRDAEGVFLTVDPPESPELEGEHAPTDTAEGGSAGELETLREELREAVDQQGALREEVAQLKEELENEKAKVKELWQMSCTQLSQFDSSLAEKDDEIALLREQLARVHHSSSRTSPEVPELGGDEDSASPVRRLPQRRGKAPPVEMFTGEDPDNRLDDWLPMLQRAARWNNWTADELLIQLAGHLKGRARQEWYLLSESSKESYEAGVTALRSRLDPGSKAMAAQDFRHASQEDGEKVADFIRRLERIFRLAYGHDHMLLETRDTLLFSQLQEGLKYKLMESPAVSGATSYATLCVAAKSEERWQAALRKRRQYKPENLQPSRAPRKPPSQLQGSGTVTPPSKGTPVPSSGDVRSRKCWNCEKTGHFAKDCRAPRKESAGRSEKKTPGTRMVQSSPSQQRTVPQDDPLQYLLSDSDDSSDSPDVRQVRVFDTGSRPQSVRVLVGGVPIDGIVDSGADITIVGGDVFKRIAAVAKLRKRDFKPPDKTPRNYDQQPFCLDGRVDLDISFEDRTMKTPVYVKMDASEQLLLSEGVCRQLGVISYHPEVHPAKANKKTSSAEPEAEKAECQVPTVRVQLVQSLRLPPNQSAMVDVRLIGGRGSEFECPVLFEPDSTLQEEHGVQVSDALLQCSREGTAKVLLTNCLGFCQRTQEGLEIGSVSPAEVIDPQAHSSAPVLGSPERLTWDPEEALRPAVNVVSGGHLETNIPSQQESWRKRKLWEVLAEELTDSSLPVQERRSLSLLLEEYHEVFSLEEGERGETDLVELHIETGDALPRKQPVRRVPFAVRKEIARQLKEMQSSNVIQPSNSPWASPIVLVRKKDGTLRFCVDFRCLNSVTKPDTFPLPRIDDLLDQLGKSRYFSTLDLAAGFWQIKVDEASREKTAFITQQGLFEFRVMPFGLTNAPAVFQRLMQKVLSGLNPDGAPEFVEVYIDDVLIFSRTMEEHLDHLRQVLERLKNAGLKLKPSKCHFIRQTVEYLGHVITPQGLMPNQKQVSAVKDFPVPESVTQVRQFLGLMSYYRRFIQQFAKIAFPLHNLTRKDVEFLWTEECQAAFEALKGKLVEAPILVYPDFDRSFVLETDASVKGLGAVLSQQQSDGRLHPVAFASRSLSAPEKNYSITELETLAVVWAIQHYHAYLYGHEVTVVTDHSAIKAILETPSPSGKHARWWLKVFGSGVGRVHIIYRPGSQNARADALSRNPVLCPNDEHVDLDVQVARVESLQDVEISELLEAPELPGLGQSDFHQEQRKDPGLKKLCDFLEDGTLPDGDKEAKKIAAQALHFSIIDRILYFVDPKGPGRKRAAVPTQLQEKILHESHGGVMAGHFSGNRLHNTLARHWWWETMYRDALSFCKNCAECAVVSGTGRKHRPPLHPIPVQRPFQIMGVDIMELPVTQRGNRYVIVFQDFLTKWPLVFPAPDQKAIRIARLLAEEIVPMFGVPESLLSDRGTNLLAHVMQDTCRLLGVTKLNTTAYHPQCDGMVERMNRTLKAMLRKHAASFGCQWDRYLPGVLWAYRNTPHEATKEKPSFLLFGVDCRSPTEAALLPSGTVDPTDVDDYREELILSLSSARELAVTNIRAAQRRYKEQYDRKSKPAAYKLGDWVLVRFPHEESGKQRKLSRPWHGPYRVTQRNDPDVTLVKVFFPDEGSIQVHQSRVCQCPPKMPVGFYWYGGNRKSPGRVPQWLQRLVGPTSGQTDPEQSIERTPDDSGDGCNAGVPEDPDAVAEDGVEESSGELPDLPQVVPEKQCRYSLRDRSREMRPPERLM